MWKDAKAIILPTNSKSSIYQYKEVIPKLIFDNNIERKLATPHHLYIISLDEEIKEGDWVLIYIEYRWILKQIVNADTLTPKTTCYIRHNDNNRFEVYREACKKVIAATDINLKVKEYSIAKYVTAEYLPQIPQQFIEEWIAEYNKQNILEIVQIEYEDKGYQKLMNPEEIIPTKQRYNWQENISLKLSEGNYLSLRRKEKRVYTREDLLSVMNLGMTLRQNQLNGSDFRSGKEVLNNWIKQNL